MWKKQGREWSQAIAICIVLGFILFGLIMAINKNGIGSSDAAGWAQAIGSVAAIVAAVFIMNMQHRLQEKTAIANGCVERANLILTAVMFGQEINEILNAIRNNTGTGQMEWTLCTFSLERLGTALGDANNVPIWKMGSIDARQMAILKNSCKNTIAVLRAEEEKENRAVRRTPQNMRYLGGGVGIATQATQRILHFAKTGIKDIGPAIESLRAEYETLTGMAAPI